MFYALQPIDSDSLYTVLGVPKDASEADIKASYRKLALKVSSWKVL